MRSKIPDKISISLDIGYVFVKGASGTVELNLITRGKESGFFVTSTENNRTGFLVDLGVNISAGNYLGPVEDITRASYLGLSKDWDGGFIYGGSLWSSFNEAGVKTWTGGKIGYGLTIGLARGIGETYHGLY